MVWRPYKNLSGSCSSAVFKTPRYYPYCYLSGSCVSPRLASALYRSSISNSLQARLSSNRLDIFFVYRDTTQRATVFTLWLPLSCSRVAALLQQHIPFDVVLIHGASQHVRLVAQIRQHFIKVPRRVGLAPCCFGQVGKLRVKPLAPAGIDSYVTVTPRLSSNACLASTKKAADDN